MPSLMRRPACDSAKVRSDSLSRGQWSGSPAHVLAERVQQLLIKAS